MQRGDAERHQCKIMIYKDLGKTATISTVYFEPIFGDKNRSVPFFLDDAVDFKVEGIMNSEIIIGLCHILIIGIIFFSYITFKKRVEELNASQTKNIKQKMEILFQLPHKNNERTLFALTVVGKVIGSTSLIVLIGIIATGLIWITCRLRKIPSNYIFDLCSYHILSGALLFPAFLEISLIVKLLLVIKKYEVQKSKLAIEGDDSNT